MTLSIWESIEEVAMNFKDFIVSSGRNPVLWVGLFLLGLVIFFFTYNALHKN